MVPDRVHPFRGDALSDPFQVAGVRMDRLGSKPLLSFTMVLGFMIGAGWWLAASGVLSPGWGLSVPLMLLLGLINALYSAANNRLALTAGH